MPKVTLTNWERSFSTLTHEKAVLCPNLNKLCGTCSVAAVCTPLQLTHSDKAPHHQEPGAAEMLLLAPTALPRFTFTSRSTVQHAARMRTSGVQASASGWQMSPSWRQALANDLSQPYFVELQKFVESEREQGQVFPPRSDQFAAFQACAFEEVRVVILGQDPYPGTGHANGLAFSVHRDVPRLPSSLRNIYRELHDDLGIPPAQHGCLSSWSAQGCLLLNSVLTVRAGQPKSHSRQGWELFTSAVVSELVERRTNLVFMLWGNDAQRHRRLIDEERHLVLCAPHPSPLSAHRGFFGCKHFSQANAHLLATAQAPIDWRLPGAAAAPAATTAAPHPTTTSPKIPPAAPAASVSATVTGQLPTASPAESRRPSRPPGERDGSVGLQTRFAREAADAIAAVGRQKRAAPLPMPARLSPSSVATFRDCPQLFLFRYLWKLPEPPTKCVRGLRRACDARCLPATVTQQCHAATHHVCPVLWTLDTHGRQTSSRPARPACVALLHCTPTADC